MRSNPLKSALKSGQAQIGSWLSLGDVFATRFMARMGFHYLTVDLEHSPIDWHQAGVLFAAIADAGCVPLARVPEGRHDHIKRVLDAGAMGIICPMVDTVEQAKACIAAAKYPPTGNRSVGGALHALNFSASAGDYYARANDEVVVILQTESPRGVENAPEIYRLPGVDAIFVGPNDLRAQMRSPDGKDPSAEEFEAMLQRVLDNGNEAGLPVGLHVQSVPDVQRRVEQGWKFLAIGSELSMMVSRAQQIAGELKLTNPAADLARY